MIHGMLEQQNEKKETKLVVEINFESRREENDSGTGRKAIA